jgi:GAF domain-containing protein
MVPGRDWAAYLAEVSEDLLARGEEPVTLERVVSRGVEVVPGAEGCGLTLHRRRSGLRTVEASDAVVREVDELQYALGEGPCLDTAQGDATLRVEDTGQETRWPRWAAGAAQRGWRSVLSVKLRADGDDLGALNLYAGAVGAFDDHAVEVAEVYAVHAANALRQSKLVSGLRTALASRHEIGMAQGVLVGRYDLDGEQAFEVLRRISNDANLKLRDVAARVVAQRGLPGDTRGPDPTRS